MKTKKEVMVLGIFVFVFFLSFAQADIYMGTCEGYVKWINGTLVTDANVTVTVQGCTTPPENCVRSALTDSGGYYVIANLNLPPYGNVTGTAQKGSTYGTATAQADAYQAAFMNITVCETPTSPILLPVSDSHYPNITFWFNWTSGSSPYTTFDQWHWLGSWQNASSPQNRSNLGFAEYTWGARTCLSSLPSCCSPPAYDSFLVYNSRPCTPILTPQNDTTNNTVTLNWSSNTIAPCPDADNDTTYYNFKIDGNLITNATPPQTVSGLSGGWHTWQVQECDPWECSDWATDAFNIYNTACPAPNITVQNNTCNNQVTLRWQSATVDPDGDPCHDEFIFENTTFNNATSPQTVTMTQTDVYDWAVRSCDDKGACSPWVSSSFIYCTCVGNVTIEEECVRRGLGGGGLRTLGYELMILAPKELYPGESFEIKIDLKSFENRVNLTFIAEAPEGIVIDSVNHGPATREQEIKIELKGKVSINMKEGDYIIYIKVYDNINGTETTLINKPVEVKVSSPPSPPFMLIRLSRPEWPLLPLILLLVIIIICIIMLVKLIKKRRGSRHKEKKLIGKIKEEAKKI